MNHAELVDIFRQSLAAATEKSAREEIAQFLGEVLEKALSQEADIHALQIATLAEVRACVLNVLDVLSPACEFHPLTRSIRREAEEVITAVYDTWRRLSSEESGSSETPNFSSRSADREFEHAKGLLNLELMVRIGQFGGGRSGSPVFKVEYRDHASGLRLGALKLFENREELLRERSAHEQASKSWLGDKCAQVPVCPESFEADPGPYPLLAPLAFPPTARTSNVPSMHDLIVEGRKDARDIARELGRTYATGFIGSRQTASKSTSKRNLWGQILAHWGSAGREAVWEKPYYWHEAGLPNASTPCVLDNGTLAWNPLYVVTHPNLINQDEGVFVFAFQHGDLNTENVLVGSVEEKEGLQVQLIDFEKAANQSAVLDCCWLGLWGLRSSHRSTPPSFDQWNHVPESAISAAIHHEEAVTDLGNFELGVQILRILFKDLLALPNASADKQEAGLMARRISEQVSVTMAAASLAMAFYEVRSLVRALNEQLEKENTSTLVLHRCWAITFFRIAAACLKDHIDERPLGPSVDLTESLRSSRTDWT